MLKIEDQACVIDGFRIIKVLGETVSGKSKDKDIIASLHELQEVLVKDCLFKVTDLGHLRQILESLQTASSEKN